jgi:hypothetical protein
LKKNLEAKVALMRPKEGEGCGEFSRGDLYKIKPDLKNGTT